MVRRAHRRGASLAEVPITLHRDGRTAHPPHLKTFSDGWRTLRLFLMASPRWLFLEPGKLLVLLGLLLYAVALPGLRIHGIHFSAHTLVFATLMLLCGYQSILFAIAVKTFAISQGIAERDPRIDRLLEKVTVERGLIAGAIMLLAG